MRTKTRTNHKQFFALVKNLGIEDYKRFLFDYTGGQTDSLSELREVYPQTYNALLQQLQKMSESTEQQEMDKWRKRLLAVIFGWAETIDEPMHMNKVKAIACRASGYGNFNDIPRQRLQSLYNAFMKMKKDMVAVEEMTRELLSYLKRKDGK